MSKQKDETAAASGFGCLNRRAFLFASGATVGGTVLLTGVPGMGKQAVEARVSRYPRMFVENMSRLAMNEPVRFKYPDKGRNSNSILVRMGEPAGGGIGPDRNIVAFNTLCTHMGGDMGKTFKASDAVLGPCPFHQSTFDLTRHGMIVSGHATESLPQVLLEVEGDDIYAVGLIGLIYGRYDNLKS